MNFSNKFPNENVHKTQISFILFIQKFLGNSKTQMQTDSLTGSEMPYKESSAL